jgi:integrase
MKGSETPGNQPTDADTITLDTRRHGRGQYQKVFDARKRRLRGLWERNGTYYGRLTITTPATGVKDFTCHLCRHYFASMALMSKVDVHTVASWLGHQDNGVLLAQTYSHLLNEHKQAQAKHVTF